MTGEDVVAIAVIVATTLVVGALIVRWRLPHAVKWILVVGLMLRFGGAYSRQEMARDARGYFKIGERYAAYFSELDFSPVFDPELWRGTSWIGTNAIGYPTGLIITLLGSSWLAAFFTFALISFVGLVAYGLAFRRSFLGAPYAPYWAWLFLMPSLWFWPASIGKEALMLFGLGIATLGLAGRNGRISLPVVTMGLAVVFCIRPQVVAIFLLAAMLTHWLRMQSWSPRRILQGLVILMLGFAGVRFSMSTALRGEVDVESLVDYMEENAGRNSNSGSSIRGVTAGPAGVPAAIMNVLFRPYLWEAHNARALISALEVILIWGLIWHRRRGLWAALIAWRSHAMLTFAVLFTVLYVVALGMNLSNLGLIARQRTLVFPFLFMIVEAGYHFRQRGTKTGAVAPGSPHSEAYGELPGATVAR